MASPAPQNYPQLLAAYEAERPNYERLVLEVIARLKAGLTQAQINASLKGRTKEPTSFARKALFKGYSDPLTEIGDKAGVRVTVIYSGDVARVEQVVRQQLHVTSRESKLDALAYDQFGYLGVHCDARLQDGEATGANASLAGLRIEVQIRTMAQSAWAEVSHEQLYKAPADVPDQLKRRIHRLVALVELFDSEVDEFRSTAEAIPGYREALALTPLMDELLQRFDIRVSPDRQLSLLMAAAVVPLYGCEAEEIYQCYLERWVRTNEDALRVQFEEAQTLPTNPLFLQPEIFLIFERLENDQARLQNAWPDQVPPDWYDDIARSWGS